MKLKFKETIDREVEITLPAYQKSNCHFWKIISEKEVIKITELDNWNGIDQSTIAAAYTSTNEPSTEEEFNEAYKRVLTFLNDLKTK